MARAAKSYRINLVRSLRENERKQERKRRIQALVGVTCFAVLALAFVYSGFAMWKMESVLAAEKDKLAQVQAEYNKYTATRMIVEKGDVELLNALQGRGIFWTKKLAALAKHLPDNYTITKFAYANGELRVSGLGTASSRQDHLLVLDGYLNRLRADSAFSNVFSEIYLNVAQNEESASGRVAFEFSALYPGGQARR
jgi:Tfp pilus assembly protein PilN